jgi:benzoyl-CoA reductase subunit C
VKKGEYEMREKFSELLDKRHENIWKWKEEGRKIIGYLCTYTPEELIYAAGAVPVRILGAAEPASYSDPYLQSFYCPFARSCLDQGLKGKYDYLDGIIAPLTCDTLRGVFDIWKRKKSLAYADFIDFPSVVNTSEAKVFLLKELSRVKESLEKFIGKIITQSDLIKAIEIYNTNRSLIRKLYSLRKQECPPISGTEALQIVLSSMVTPKEEHNRLLETLLQELDTSQQRVPNHRIRLMLGGSVIESTDLVALIENSGSWIVTDDLCTGTRYFWDNISTNSGDPLSSIADRYLKKIPCPTKHPPEPRFDHILALLDEFKVQGILTILQKFCDPHELDYPCIEELLQQQGIPHLCIDFDNTSAAAGQVKTRVQAFLEMIGG